MGQTILLFLKGMLMGAADIVPGVSGGTIAFITGIYERLINSIKSVLPEFFHLLKHREVSRFWSNINGNFLAVLFAGIILSILALANLISFLLVSYPIPLWAFFFGLIVASVWAIAQDIDRWNISVFLLIVVGAAVAWVLTTLNPMEMQVNNLTIFMSGFIAICAMILPGISGSFILLLLGTYGIVLGAIKAFDFALLAIFATGCLCGLLTIANILSWTYRRFRLQTLAVLTGFMIGALNKVWPWKEVLQTRVNSKGEIVPLVEQNVMPDYYESVTGNSAMLEWAIACAILAAGLVVILNWVGKKEV